MHPLSSVLTVVVPTCNSARWIAALAAYYRKAAGLAVLFALDARSADATRTKLDRLGENYIILHTPHQRVEAMVGMLRERVPTNWILRIDDDECPSPSLINWLNARDWDGPEAMVGLPRRWLRWQTPWLLEFCALKSWDHHLGEDRQIRLFRADRVHYTEAIHTPGFEISSPVAAPTDCAIYHLDWILRDRVSRERKMRLYDEQCVGAGSEFSQFYLPETVTAWDVQQSISPTTNPHLYNLARRFYRARWLAALSRLGKDRIHVGFRFNRAVRN